MTKQYYQLIYDDLLEIRNYMDSLFQQIQETCPIALLPASHEPERKLLPGVQDNLKVTVVEYSDEIVVTAEMVPGDLIKDIKIDLIHPTALKISCIRREWKKEEKWEYSMCEHCFGYISQIIPLPKPVVENGSHAVYKGGCLEVYLKKEEPENEGQKGLQNFAVIDTYCVDHLCTWKEREK